MTKTITDKSLLGIAFAPFLFYDQSLSQYFYLLGGPPDESSTPCSTSHPCSFGTLLPFRVRSKWIALFACPIAYFIFMLVHFTKMQGLGNDFVVLDTLKKNIKLTDTLVQRIANRHLGIGCDQVLLLEAPQDPDTDFFFRFFNPDGQEVEQCGNGLRCLGQYIFDNKLHPHPTTHIACLSGLHDITLEKNGHIRVDMGIPYPLFPPISISLPDFSDSPYRLYPVDLGNPHIIIPINNFSLPHIPALGQTLATHPEVQACFHTTPNISFMQIDSPTTLSLRVFERGAGETLACGSAACAASLVGMEFFQLEKELSIKFPIGELHIKREDNGNLIQIGPAVRVFTGCFMH